TGSRWSVFGGDLLGSGLMLAAALIAARFGVAAGRKPLESVSRPLAAAEGSRTVGRTVRACCPPFIHHPIGLRGAIDPLEVGLVASLSRPGGNLTASSSRCSAARRFGRSSGPVMCHYHSRLVAAGSA